MAQRGCVTELAVVGSGKVSFLYSSLFFPDAFPVERFAYLKASGLERINLESAEPAVLMFWKSLLG